MPNIIEPEKVNLQNHPSIKENTIQQKIAENPAILGLGGDLILKDKERIQPHAGRLDLLLQDQNTNRRYEVEIQLGKTDESHIIRTIEYWDNERKRYTQYDHCAVIIAEEITNRFHNVISLFNGNIPLIAIKMTAYKFGEDIALTFNTVLDEMTHGYDEDDEEEKEITDRNYWIGHGTQETVRMADQVLAIINEFAPGYQLKYNKFYIGLVKDGQPTVFVALRPRKVALNIDIRIPFSEEIQKQVVEHDLDDIGYDKRWNTFRFRLAKNDISTKHELLKELLMKSWENAK